ncbi:MAG: ATP-binding protein [Pyrinomonadaceae bacterium]
MPQEKAKDHSLKAVPKRVSFQDADDANLQSEECPKCYGTGMELVPGKGARICSCRKLKSHHGQFDSVRLPKRYDGFHFGNYKPQNESQTIALKSAMTFAMEYPAVERGLLLMGSVGVGKTHLAVSILKGLTERGFSCLFYEFGSLLKEIQDSYNASTQSSELGVLTPVLSADVLVLDELGASKPTDWVRDTMAHVINTRYNEKKFTIFTTNYLDNRPNEREETLEDRIGVRVRSRLYEMCRTVTLEGKDFRKTFDVSFAAKK